MRVTTIGAVAEIFDGPHATPTRTTIGPYFLNITSLNNGRLDLAESDHVSDEDFEKWTRRVTPRAGDLLFSYETRLGEAALMPAGVDACLGRRMALLRFKEEQVDPRYFLYYFLSPGFKKLIEARTVHGATVNRIALSTMADWPIELPILAEQQAIAEILGVLDDKIAANRKQADTAGGLVRALFDEASRGLPNSDQSFADLALVSGGGTPSTSSPEYWDGDINWATPTDITALTAPYLRSTGRMISVEGLANCASKLYPAGSILMTSRATIGAFAMTEVPTAVNQGFIVVNAEDPQLQWWLFHEMNSRVAEFTALANGATFLELSRGRFKELKVRLPAVGRINEFTAHASKLHGSASAAESESRMLATIRDTLLPQLISGRLRVRDAERQVEAVL
uniref:restriction endonuclease subunit S n=1 Tax=Rhodococcus oryzae TaxID=2571143 RepID=UPI00145CDD81|nr:restriction endonuclease subunit S [Rhodococcus oryzae]